MENNDFLNNVKKYNNRRTVRFHMPGHKGIPIDDYQNNLIQHDITELRDTDNLYDPIQNGGIRQLMEYARNLYGSANTILSAGGATLCIQTAIMSVVRTYGKKRIMCDRRCHKSVINTLILCDVEPIWVDAAYPIKFPSNISALIITSPDYYGNMFDVKSISESCHENNILLICDNAHGSHLIYYNGGYLHPIKNNADIVIDSLHKTLPAMTGAALLHTNYCVSEEILLSSLRLFASTSPSYPISMSIYSCLKYMKNYQPDLVIECKIKLRNIGYNVLDGELYDPFRICINLKNAGDLYNYLYDNDVVCEFFDVNNVIIIPSIMNTIDDFNRLIDLCARFTPLSCDKTEQQIYIPKKLISPREAVINPYKIIDINEALNQICAEIIAPYPPGIPLIVPGELMDEYIIGKLKYYGYNQIKIYGGN